MRGLIYDGLSARGNTAAVTIAYDTLVISYADGAIDRIPLNVLARGVRTPERITLHRDDAPDWRLVIHAEPDLPGRNSAACCQSGDSAGKRSPPIRPSRWR